MTFKTTKGETKIIDKLPHSKIEDWAKDKEYWKIYKVVIKTTKEHLKQKLNQEKEK